MITWADRAKAATAKAGRHVAAKTDETPGVRLSSVSAVPKGPFSSMNVRLSSVLAVTSPTFLEKHDATIAVGEHPDRWCWPRSSAMNGTEIDFFLTRLQHFVGKGLARSKAEALTDKLVLRDRESDDRRVCMECKTFTGYGAASWRCGNWQAAGVATHSRDAQLPADLMVQLQRCDEFTVHPMGIPDQRDRGFRSIVTDDSGRS